MAPALDRLRGTDPRRWLIAFDFDGTLAAIVPKPEDAVLDPGLEPVLEQLRGHIGALAVVSGRERAVLASRLPSGWMPIGSYGLELPPSLSETGFPPGFDPARAERDLEAARIALQELSSTLPGTLVEVKRWGLALHFRAVPELAQERENWRRFRGLALRNGMSAIEGRLVFEMKPKDSVDKGWVMAHLLVHLSPSAAVFTGDDLGDVPAWDRLRQASTELPTLAVGVGSTEAPAVMGDVCDLVLPSRDNLQGFARALLARAEG